MAGKGRSGSGRWTRLAFTLTVMLLLTSGMLAGLYYYMQYVLSQNEREGFSQDDLMVPLPDEMRPESEEAPLFIRPGSVPSFSCRLVWPINGTSEMLDGYEGIGAVLNLTLINEGISRLYVERVQYSTGWGSTGSREVDLYVEPGSRRYIGHMMMEISYPAPAREQLTYDLTMDVLVKGPLSWVRKESMEFETSRINLIEVAPEVPSPEYIHNNHYYYDKVNDMIEPEMDELNAIVSNNGLDDGVFTVQDIVEGYLFVYDSIEYMEDPDSDSNEWISPLTCLSRGGGDCEDYSVLLGAVITSMGGNARVIVTSGHAFISVYIGSDDSILDDINDRFSIDIPFQIIEDELGLWLVIEPQAYHVFGWFPSDVRVQEGIQTGTYIYKENVLGWAYEDSDEVYIVDIYI